MKHHLLAAALGAVALTGSPGAVAADDPPDEMEALELADQAKGEVRDERSWRAYVEAAASRAWLRGTGTATANGRRAAFDLRYDGRPAAGWRAVLSNRLDVVDDGGPDGTEEVNALREAYVSWQARPDVALDLGRVNVRNGAAWGYNPTDFFKGGSLRSIVSPDPALLRENRLGTVVVQAQKVWADSALTATLSPKLERLPSDAPFSLDLGSTNGRNRWLLAGSHRFGERFNPQVLLHGGQDTPTQLGLNLSSLLTSSTVGFVEWSTGNSRSQAAEALGLAQPNERQHRAAVGATFTTPFNLSLTAEVDYNSAGLDRAGWDALLAQGPANVLQVLQTAQSLQDLPVRRGAFLYATWRDLLIRRLDLSGFLRFDLVTHSREQWLEARYRWERADVALQWHANTGDPGTVYGMVPRRRLVELSGRVYF